MKQEKLKILITGSRGFVGRETVRLLEKEGHEVIHYDLMDGFDILDYDQLAGIKKRPDRILHLAAIARFADADKDPKLAFETNVIGTRNVVEVCKKFHIPLVYASSGSSAMPLNNYPTPFTEDIPARGNSVYGCTKALGEYLVKEHTPHIIVRYSHLLGAEKRFHGLVGGFISRIERGLEPELNGGGQSNDFLYVKDVARANMLALTAPWDKWNQVYNIGTGIELTAKEAGEMVCKIFGYKGKIKVTPRRTVDADRFVFDVSKAKTMLGFEAKWTFKDALKDMKKELDKKQ